MKILTVLRSTNHINFYLAKRCRCLGEFKRRSYSRDALDKFCRNDTVPGVKESGPIYTIMDSLERNATGSFIPQIVPNKTRCGNLDPVEMNDTNKCYCRSKDGKGAGTLQNLLITPNYFIEKSILVKHTRNIT